MKTSSKTLVNQQNVAPLITCSRMTVYTTISTSIFIPCCCVWWVKDDPNVDAERKLQVNKSWWKMAVQPETHSTLTKPNQRQGAKTRELNSTLTNTDDWDMQQGEGKQREPIRSNKERKWTRRARDRRVKQEVDTETHETQRPAHGEQTQEEEYKQDQINAKENDHSCPQTTKHKTDCYTQEMTTCRNPGTLTHTMCVWAFFISNEQFINANFRKEQNISNSWGGSLSPQGEPRSYEEDTQTSNRASSTTTAAPVPPVSGLVLYLTSHSVNTWRTRGSLRNSGSEAH